MSLIAWGIEEEKRIKKHNSLIISTDNKILFPEIVNLLSKNQINKILKKFKIKYEMKSFEFFNWNNNKINKKIFKKYYKQKHLTKKIVSEIASYLDFKCSSNAGTD